MKKLAAFLVVLFLLPGTSLASVVVGSADYTGSRSTPPESGVVGNGRWSESSDGFTVSWNIIHQANGLWSYSYAFSDNISGLPPADPGVSHFILEVSPFITSANILDYFVFAEGTTVLGAQTWEADEDYPPSTSPGANGGNPNLPADLYGIKFNYGSGTYSFLTSQQPVWGDFYVKDGRGEWPQGSVPTTAWNTSIGTDPGENDSFTNWMPTPDTEPGVLVPEPSLAVLAIGAMVAGFYSRRRKQDDAG